MTRRVECHCRNCGWLSRPQRFTHGSIVIETILWVTMFPIGLAYSVWRFMSRDVRCGACGAVNAFIPADSPNARGTPRRPPDRPKDIEPPATPPKPSETLDQQMDRIFRGGWTKKQFTKV